jgi:hypothetical protein
VRELTDKLDTPGEPVYLEGFGAGLSAVFEMPFTYHAANESTGKRLAISTAEEVNAGSAYLGGRKLEGPHMVPNYRLVLTRLGGIQTRRAPIARRGPFVLERRTEPVDVSVESGVAVDDFEHDRQGQAWVQPPLVLLVAAPAGVPVSALIELTGSAANAVTVTPGGRVLSRSPGALTLCIPVIETGALRRVPVPIDVSVPVADPEREFVGRPPFPPAVKALRLVSMSAAEGQCPRREGQAGE